MLFLLPSEEIIERCGERSLLIKSLGVAGIEAFYCRAQDLSSSHPAYGASDIALRLGVTYAWIGTPSPLG